MPGDVGFLDDEGDLDGGEDLVGADVDDVDDDDKDEVDEGEAGNNFISLEDDCLFFKSSPLRDGIEGE